MTTQLLTTQQRTPRIRLIAALGALGVVALLPACGKSTDNAGINGNATASNCPVGAFDKASSPTTIKLWHSYVGKAKTTLEALAAKYNATQPKVKVEVESQGTSYVELLRNFKNALPTKNLPAITIGEDIDTQYMADSGVVLPASDCQAADPAAAEQTKDILPAVKAAYTVKGVQYPASMNVSTIVLYYNKEHFRKAGLDPEKPPTTLAEVKAAAEKLKASGASKQPFVMKLDPWFVEQWTTGAGQTLVNQNNGRDGTATAATLTNPATTEAMNWVAGMKAADLLNGVPGTDGQINHYLAMATGSSSMLLETSAAITTINGVLEGSFDPKDLGSDLQLPPGFKVSIDLGVGLNPGITEPGKGQIGGGAWYITNTGTPEVQSAAWDFVKFFNTTASQVQWTIDGGYLPILDSAKSDPTLKSDWETSRRGKWLATAYGGISTLNPGFPGALIGPYDKFRDEFRKALEGVGLNAAPVDASLSSANAAITKQLEAYKANQF